MGLSDIVNVSIVASTQYPSAPGFGVPLILGYHTRFGERVRYYTSTAAMLADGFLTTDAEYIAALALMSQNPSVSRFAIGRRTRQTTKIVDLTPAISGAGAAKIVIYTLTVNGTNYTYTTDGSATVKEIIDGLVAAFAGPHGGVTASNVTDTKLRLTGTAGTYYTWAVSDNDGNANGMGLWTVENVTTDSHADDDIGDCAAASSDWYAFMLTEQNAADGALCATWAEANKKLFAIDLADTILKTSSSADLASTLKSAARERTFVSYHAKVSEFMSAAWLGNCLPYDPGEETWKFKTLSGITADVLTDGEVGYLRGKYCNWYQSLGGVNITSEGKTSKPQFIDVVRFIDWLTANLQIDVFGALAGAAKIPYTDAGVAKIESVIRARLALGVKVGGLSDSPAPSVTVPRVANELAADRAARTIPDIYFTATLAGAIHSLTINGVVSV